MNMNRKLVERKKIESSMWEMSSITFSVYDWDRRNAEWDFGYFINIYYHLFWYPVKSLPIWKLWFPLNYLIYENSILDIIAKNWQKKLFSVGNIYSKKNQHPWEIWIIFFNVTLLENSFECILGRWCSEKTISATEKVVQKKLS